MLRFLRRFALWTVVCGTSAAPSFLCGLALNDEALHIAAMASGILCFVVGYTLLTGTDWFAAFKRRRHVKRTLYIGFGTRLLISIVYPIGFWPDVLCGLLSVRTMEWVLGPTAEGLSNNRIAASFIAVFLTTILQGVILNLVLSVYMAILYVAQRLIFRRRGPVEGCARCGYDLRASTDRCPECGTPIAGSSAVAACETEAPPAHRPAPEPALTP